MSDIVTYPAIDLPGQVMQNSRILLIDKEASFVDSQTRFLQGIYGFVQGATDLRHVYKLLDSDEYDVIIFNTSIDDSNGFETLNFLAACESHPSIIAYSEIPDVRSVVEILKSGVFDFLVAPFDSTRLTESINSGIENRKAFLEIMNLNETLRENQNTIEQEKEYLKRKNTELNSLAGITKVLAGSLDLNEILHEIISGIYNVFHFDRIFVSLIDAEKRIEEAKVAMGVPDSIYDETISALKWNIDDNQCNPWMEDLLVKKEVVKVIEPLDDERYKECEIVRYHPKTFYKVPLMSKGNVVGSLTFDNANSDRIVTDEELTTLRVFSDQAGLAIEKVRLYDNLKSAHDTMKNMQKKIIEAEKLTAVNEVAVSVNHEINNPLCSISLSIEMLKREFSDSGVLVGSKLDMIEKDIERIKNITSQLSNIKSFETKEYTGEVRMIDIKRSLHMPKE